LLAEVAEFTKFELWLTDLKQEAEEEVVEVTNFGWEKALCGCSGALVWGGVGGGDDIFLNQVREELYTFSYFQPFGRPFPSIIFVQIFLFFCKFDLRL